MPRQVQIQTKVQRGVCPLSEDHVYPWLTARNDGFHIIPCLSDELKKFKQIESYLLISSNHYTTKKYLIFKRIQQFPSVFRLKYNSQSK